MHACRDSARSTRPCHCLRRRVRLPALRCPMHANIVRSPGAPRRRGCQPRGLRADPRAHGDRLHRLTSAAPRSLAPRPRVLRRLDGLDPLTDDASGLAWISIAECDPAVELGLLDERPAFVALTGDPPVASWGPRRVFGRYSPERMNMSCPTVGDDRLTWNSPPPSILIHDHYPARGPDILGVSCTDAAQHRFSPRARDGRRVRRSCCRVDAHRDEAERPARPSGERPAPRPSRVDDPRRLPWPPRGRANNRHDRPLPP